MLSVSMHDQGAEKWEKYRAAISKCLLLAFFSLIVSGPNFLKISGEMSSFIVRFYNDTRYIDITSI